MGAVRNIGMSIRNIHTEQNDVIKKLEKVIFVRSEKR